MFTVTAPVSTAAAAIHAAYPADAGRALAVLTRAFECDPMVRWAFADDQAFRTCFPQFARGFGGRAFDVSTADRTADFSGVALWLPPGADSDESKIMAALEAGSDRLKDLDSVFAQMGEFRPRERHWYLPLIGVDPACQGQGIGSALLEHAIGRIEQSDTPVAYLEATNPANVALYRRFGFEPVGKIQAGDSPVMVPMVRR